jgi:hypothetical protein
MNPVPKEHAEQSALITWANLSAAAHPELGLLFAIPNGSFLGDGVKRLASGKAVSLGAIRSRKLKAEGVKTGVPDLCLPVARGGFHGLYIEMKRTQGGTLSPEQKQWRQDLIEQGYHVALCKGQPAAQHTLTTYLTLPKTQLTKASQAQKNLFTAFAGQPTTSPDPTPCPAPQPPPPKRSNNKPHLKW